VGPIEADDGPDLSNRRKKGMSRLEDKEHRSKLDLCCIRESLVKVASFEIGGC
jgi:hypothetical protein